MSHSDHQGHDGGHGKVSGSGIGVVLAILAVFALYGALLSQGLPQKWTEYSKPHEAATAHASETTPETAPEKASHAEKENAENVDPAVTKDGDAHALTVEKDAVSESAQKSDHAEQADDHVVAHDADHDASHAKPAPPPTWTIAPFVILLLCIAILPLVPATSHWWEHNSSKFLVAATLGILTLAYYLFLHNSPVMQHWPVPHKMVEATGGLNTGVASTVFMNAIVADYIPFIVLLFTLYTISGGIRIEGDLRAKPITNTIIMAIGAVLASFIGTTGAAMLLIRLLLETNKERKIKAHTVIFFIFIVCNCGGLLTPLGDPPLFLGYLKEVKFTFTFRLTSEWAFVNGLLLAVYFFWDTLFAYPRESKSDLVHDTSETRPLQVKGLMPNLFLLAGVVLSIMFLAPSKPIFGWYPWFFFREIVQLGLVFLSLTLGRREIRVANGFNYSAIVEVAALFFGIFLCMQAPLQILNVYGSELGIQTPMQFFWATGTLSSFLDNAPTYVVFFETAGTLIPEAEKANAIAITGVAIDAQHLAAVSLGAVFMGAMTYIGNGPNFMVKAIAEQSGVKMPSFFGYMVYSCLVLLPILIAMTLIFLSPH